MSHRNIALWTVFFGLINISLAARSTNGWKCTRLLDSQTKSQLNGYEKFFDELFQFPPEYKNASASEKKKLEKQWVKQLDEQNPETSIAAAAYLGMVQSKPAARFIEKAVVKRGGRFRWVCTRSLGQIRQKSSIPVMISLLENENKNTRIYARAGLAEITGVYFGEDKEKWSAWYKDPSGVTCTEDTCILPTDASPTTPQTGSQHKINFTLPDTYGRIISSDDYLGSPTLYIFGSCWCGGCQGDMEPFRKFLNQHKSIGLQGVRVVALDNELASLDFQKHYRLNCVQLLDTNRKFEDSLNNRGGWTFLVLSDSNGNAVYQANNPKEEDYKAIYKILKLGSTNQEIEMETQNGIHHMPKSIERNKSPKKTKHERFPSIAVGPAGNVYVICTVSNNDSSDIILRWYDGIQWSQDIPVADSEADEYDGSVLVDTKGNTWLCWTSNAREKQYNIFITSLDNTGQPKAPYQLTHSDDDAMHPRMACDTQGNLWVTYYRWKKRNGQSRDKEVYVRKLSQNQWSDEIQVSPTDVPWYEDHTEPAITAWNDGVMIAWNWDFHPPNAGYSQYANSPTIFMRPVNAQMELGKIVSASEKNIDVTPTLIASGDQILCAWDSAARMKNLSASLIAPSRDNTPQNILKQYTVSNICTPCLTASEDGRVSLLWSELKDGTEWTLKHMAYQVIDKKWSIPVVILKNGNPRFPSAAYDSKGRLWVACSIETENGRKIIVESFTKEDLSND